MKSDVGVSRHSYYSFGVGYVMWIILQLMPNFLIHEYNKYNSFFTHTFIKSYINVFDFLFYIDQLIDFRNTCVLITST